MKPEYAELFKLSDVEFARYSSEERANHWQLLALDPPGFGIGSGTSWLGLKMPESVPGDQVEALVKAARALAADSKHFHQSKQFPHIFQV